MEHMEDSGFGKWCISKMEALLNGRHILVKSAYAPLMDFVALRGGDEYFLNKSVHFLSLLQGVLITQGRSCA